MGLDLKQRCTGRTKQRLGTAPLAKPAESHRVMLSWPCIPWDQVHPPQKWTSWDQCCRNSGLGHQSGQSDPPGLVKCRSTPCSRHPSVKPQPRFSSTNQGNLSLAKRSGVPAGGILPGER